MNKKLLSILLLLVILINLVPAAYAEEPEIYSATGSTAQMGEGNIAPTTTVTVTVSPNIQAVAIYLTLGGTDHYIIGSGSGSGAITCYFNPGEVGTYYISRIDCFSDSAFQTLITSFTYSAGQLSSGNVTVTPPADGTGPTVTSVSVSPASITAPGSVYVTVTAEDPSGLDFCSVAFVNSATNETLGTGQMVPSGNTYSGVINIPAGSSGTYSLLSVVVKDSLGNFAGYTSGQGNLPAGSAGLCFTVSAPAPVDITPPVVSGIYVSPAAVTVPETVTCCITATDDLSGVRYVSACFTCGNSALNCYGTPAADGSIVATIDVPAGTPAGDYRLAALTAEDNAGNVTAYSGGVLPSALIGRKFTVKAAPAPTPVSGNTAIGISVNTAYGNLGGKFTFTAYLIDAAGRPMPNRQVNFCTAYNVIGTAVTNMYGKAVFTWRPPCSGYYGVYAAFLGDYYYSGSSSTIQNIKVSNVPATADTYNLQIWLPILAVTVGFNFWLLLRKKKKQG